MLVEHRLEHVLPLIDRVIVLAPGGGVRADGPAEILSGSLGAELSSSGVWVPGHPMPARHASKAPGETVVTAIRLPERSTVLSASSPSRWDPMGRPQGLGEFVARFSGG